MESKSVMKRKAVQRGDGLSAGVRQAIPFEIASHLPKGKAVEVPIESIAHQIKKDLFTGLDMMGPLRREDIEKWQNMVSENWSVRITVNEMQGTMTFYKPA